MAFNNSSRAEREPAPPANTPRAPRPGRGPAEPAPEPAPRSQNQPRPVASASPDGEVHLRDAASRRAAEEPRRSKRPTPDGPATPPRQWQWKSGLDWLNDRRFQLFIGFTLIVAALYLAAAFVSYLFTGHADQSVVENLSGRSVREAGAESTNLLGVLGAAVSQAFLYDWFGVASFVLLPVIFFLGYRIVFRRAPVSLPWMMGLCFFLTGWISIALGYVVVARPATAGPLPEWLSGAMGFEVAAWLKAFLGAGTVLLLGLLAVSFVIGFFNVTTLSWAAAGWLDARQRRAEAREEAELEAARRKSARRATAPPIDASATGTYEQTPLGVNHALNPTAAVVGRGGETEEEFDEDIDEDTGEVLAMTGHSGNGGLADSADFDDEQPERMPATPLPTPRAAPVKPAGPTFAIELPMVEPLAAVAAATTAVTVPMTIAAPVAEAIVPVIAPLDVTIPGLTDDADDGLAPVGLTNYDPTLDLSHYQYPTLELLNDYGPPKLQVSKEELEANKDRIVETLGHYNIGIASIKATIGPTVTLYEIIPDAGVRISKIKNLEDDIALSLAALGIRIIAPIPGKGTIGIEVPNTRKEMVSMRSVLATEKFQNAEMDLPIAFGRTITNEVFVADLARMPHLLMAGATGQGKSVGLNVILTSLLYKRHPAQLKFVLVDPKKVELSLFNKIERHFLATLPGAQEAIITDTSKVVDTLNSLCILMDQRYTLLKDAGCRNLKEYNKKFIERRLLPTKGHQFMPFIVVVIDELADLMMTAGKEVETPIARLAQLARAIGIHLVVATQRPSVNVITGIIKANFPARISFKVTAKVDSRTILDASGADQLIGQGDMLFSVGSDLVRIQCAFVDTPEVDRLCDFIGAQQAYPTAYELPEYVGDKGSGNDGGDDIDDGDRDALFAEAAKVIVTHQQGSTSLLQRRLKLGYNRAGRLIDQLEKAGVVGPFEGSKSRDVLIPDEYALEQLLKRLESGGEKAPF
ncbi:MAG: DNA translocase FtsK [Hymenobacteraceae bacterium]|nr:DNA translocase FtsK [Hymenobacteraceae bacterium]